MRCGFYETEITPPLGTTIFGYPTKRVNSGVKLKLYAKACVLENDGTKAAFLILDAVQLPVDLPEAVRKRVCERTDIPFDSIVMAATHSHTSGAVRKNLGSFKWKPKKEGEPELNEELDHFYMDMLILKAADAIVLANDRLEEVDIKFAIGKAENVAYVREYYIDDGTIRTNPGYCKEKIVKPYSEANPDLPVFFFTDKNGKPKGAITSFGMHHDTVSGCEMSADYSGVVAKNLKNTFGEDFVSLFFAGFCGNTNHLNFMGEKRGEPFKKTTQEMGDILTKELLNAIAKAEPIKGDCLIVKKECLMIPKRKLPEGLIERVKELVKNPPEKGPMTIADPYSDRMLWSGARSILKTYDEDKRTEYENPVMVVRIGDCLIYSFTGEVFSQFADIINEKSPAKNILLIELAHSGEAGSYIPTKELYDIPTVYEASIYSDRLVKEAGDMMVDKAIEIAKSMFE